MSDLRSNSQIIDKQRAEIASLRAQLASARKLMQDCVNDYYIASGKVKDRDGQDGYGSLRALRLFLTDEEGRS